MPEAQPRVLAERECRELLARVSWGMLATVADGQPYAVPVGYALARDVLYLASSAGRKLDNIGREPRVCLTVCEVTSFDSWRCVLVEGEAVRVTGAAGTAAAMAAFLAQSAPRGSASVSDARRLADASFLRLSLAGMSGRER